MRILLVTFLLMLYSTSFAQELAPKLLNDLKRNFPEYRILKKTEFSSQFQKLKTERFDTDKYLNSLIEADFNNDNLSDYVVLLKSDKLRKFIFVSFVSNGISFKSHILTGQSWPENHDGTIWETMWLKPKGEPGVSKEKYFNSPDGSEYPYLKDYTEVDIERYQKSIRKYKSLNVLEKTTLSYLPHLEWDDLFYCIESFYYETGKFISLKKCD